RRHTRFSRDWSSDVCSSDLVAFLLEILFAKGNSLGTLQHVRALAVDGLVGKAVARLQNIIADYLAIDFRRQFVRVFKLSHQRIEIGRASCRERVAISVARPA